MKNQKIILLFFLILMGQYAQTEVKKPQDVFEMFFNTFLRRDQTSYIKLNNYLKPTADGQNVYSIDFTKNSDDNVAKTVAENFISEFPKETASACKKEAEDFFKQVMINFRDAKLTINKIQVVPNEFIEDQKIAKVNYTINFKIPKNIQDIPTAPEKIKADELKKYFSLLTNNLKNTNETLSFEQEFDLYEIKEGNKIYYWNGDPYELFSAPFDFYFKQLTAK
ncbi:hypothetical protein [Chryseobacterium sp.]|uniref:hypothetical protein n=1 Tax=Chryseobacterium sp. TaxID=1871047 RepID=UPI0035AF5C8C